MKAAKLVGPGNMAIEELPIPEIGDAEVLVKVEYCGICGTDVHGFVSPGYVPKGAYMGHELSGVISKVGGEVRGWERGDRVTIQPSYECGHCWACRHGHLPCCVFQLRGAIGISTDPSLPGGYAEFVRVQFPERLHALPEGVSFEEGALVEPLACALRAVRSSSIKPGDPVMVTGAGPIGLAVIGFLKHTGAVPIIATEVSDRRSELAKRFGADYVFNPQSNTHLKEDILRVTAGVGVAAVFECSGAPQALRTACDFLRPHGELVVIGLIQKEMNFTPYEFQPKELRILWSWCHGDEFPMVIDLITKGVIPFKELVSSKIRLDDIVKEGFQKLLTTGHNELKILVAPGCPTR